MKLRHFSLAILAGKAVAPHHQAQARALARDRVTVHHNKVTVHHHKAMDHPVVTDNLQEEALQVLHQAD